MNPNQSAWAVEYTDCISETSKTLPTSVLDMIVNNGKAPVMLALWEICNTSLLPSLPGPLEPGVVAPDKVLSIYMEVLKWPLIEENIMSRVIQRIKTFFHRYSTSFVRAFGVLRNMFRVMSNVVSQKGRNVNR